MIIIVYLLKSATIQLFCFCFYWILFRKLTFHSINRVVLIGILILSLALPLMPSITIESTKLKEVANVWIPSSIETIPEIKSEVVQIVTDTANMEADYIIAGIYIAISFFLLFRYVSNFQRLIKFSNKYEKVKTGEYSYYRTSHSQPFSFFRQIFIPEHYEDSQDIQLILAHENAHNRKGHSIDRMFIDLIIVIFWFNPIIFQIRKAIIEVHEYEADEFVLKLGVVKTNYQHALVEQFSNSKQPQMVSFFDTSLIKKRIIMMNKRSKDIKIMKYALIVPLLFCLTIVFTNGQNIAKNTTNLIEPVTVYLPDFMSGNQEPAAFNLPGPLVIEFSFQSNEPSIFPVKYKEEKDVRISSKYGMRMDPFDKTKKTHYGIDIAAPFGTSVIASADGSIEIIEIKTTGYGKRIIIDHGNGLKSLYGQLDEILVQEGDKINKGFVIGKVGSSGQSTAPHLHYEIIRSGKHVDPLLYINDYQLGEKDMK